MRRAAGWLVLGLVWLHQVAIALLSPLSAEDWTTKLDGPPWPGLGQVYHALIVDHPLVHAALTPLIVASIPLALATLARGRRIRPGDGDDALLLLVLATLLWLTAPHLGLACSFRSAVAVQVVGVAVACWFVVGFAAAARAAAPPGPGVLAALAAGGVLAGATTRPIAVVTFAACAWLARGTRRAPSAAGLAGVAIGLALIAPRDLARSFGLFLDRGLTGDLAFYDAYLRVPAWTAAGVLGIWLVHALIARARGRAPARLGDRDLGVVLAAILAALALTGVALITTQLTIFATVAPGAAAATALALPLVHLARRRRPRIALVVAALAFQAVVVTSSLRALVPFHRQYEARLALLEAAAPGTIATVPPYTLHRSNPWAFGEDFKVSSLRDQVATRQFGLRGIALVPRLHGAQPVPPLVLRHEVDGDAHGFPRFYSADLATARRQFADAVDRVRPRAARLIAPDLTVPDHPDTPVLAAWLDRGRVRWWRATQDDLDDRGRLRLAPDPAQIDAMWRIDLERGVADRLPRGDDGTYRLAPSHSMTAAIVECRADRCALAAVISLY